MFFYYSATKTPSSPWFLVVLPNYVANHGIMNHAVLVTHFNAKKSGGWHKHFFMKSGETCLTLGQIFLGRPLSCRRLSKVHTFPSSVHLLLGCKLAGCSAVPESPPGWPDSPGWVISPCRCARRYRWNPGHRRPGWECEEEGAIVTCGREEVANWLIFSYLLISRSAVRGTVEKVLWLSPC